MLRHLLITAVPLGASTAVALVAAWRRWAPPLAIALTAGFLLRLYLMVVAWHDPWQPPDFGYQFTAAIAAVLRHRDPLRLPLSEWHFLPAMAYVNTGMYQLGHAIHMPWQLMGRIVPVAADVALVWLVGALAGTGRQRRWAALQYALNPLPIMICAIHGQAEPVASALVAGSLLLLLRTHPLPHPSGLLFGLSIAVGSWPVLLLPGLLRALAGWRAKLTALAWAGAVPLLFFVTGPAIVGYPAGLLPGDVHQLLTPRAVIGDWGWTALVTHGDQAVSPSWARLGTLILLVILAATWYLWRRAHPVDLMSAMSLAFLAGSHRIGSQYLMWPAPYQLARPTRGTQVMLALLGAWAGAGYLWLSQAPNGGAWWLMHRPWAYSSLAIVPFLVTAMPWSRRAGEPGQSTVGRPAWAAHPGSPVISGNRCPEG